mmetsp:Transcript_33705/g.81718  ORF Transcript_33705/g.81718 Transcript_33705/m.81718 type:complete len:93 (-) Transcript_33705:2411-2689(-)
MYKGEPDIPIVAAMPVDNEMYPTATPQTANSSVLEKGRSSRIVVPQSAGKHLYDKEISALQSQGFPTGLIQALERNVQLFPLRIWVVDNSGR